MTLAERVVRNGKTASTGSRPTGRRNSQAEQKKRQGRRQSRRQSRRASIRARRLSAGESNDSRRVSMHEILVSTITNTKSKKATRLLQDPDANDPYVGFPSRVVLRCVMNH